MNLLFKNDINNFFKNYGYYIVKPHNIAYNSDTVFITAGIQPLLKDFMNGKYDQNKKLFIHQPVIRTQYLDSLSEGSSLAFVNVTSSCFNHSEFEYNCMINDWLAFLYELGLNKSNFTKREDIYTDVWGNLTLKGKRTFYYYNDLEIGDTTFFYRIDSKDKKQNFDTMSDLGFGLERIRWIINNKSYYDLYSPSEQIDIDVKALLSALALMCINDIVPSNKNVGYRFRLFSKRLIKQIDGRKLTDSELGYFKECFDYWNSWMDLSNNKDIDFYREYDRNMNRYICDLLCNEGYSNISNININIPTNEYVERLHNSGIPKEKILRLGMTKK